MSNILVLDSGLGGISILNSLRSQLPYEDFIYCADFAYLPYGEKESERIQARCIKIIEYFVEHEEIKAVVVACNSATAAAIKVLRKQFSLPFFGIEPGVKPAALYAQKGILVLATKLTLESQQFQTLVERFTNGKPVYRLATPELVELVEYHSLDDTENIRGQIISILKRVSDDFDCLLLGCTHFSFLQSYFQQELGESVQIIDTSSAISHWVKERLGQEGQLCSDVHSQGKLRFTYTHKTGVLEAKRVQQLQGVLGEAISGDDILRIEL